MTAIANHPRFAEACWAMGVAAERHGTALRSCDMIYVTEIAARFLVMFDVPWDEAREAILAGYLSQKFAHAVSSVRRFSKKSPRL